MICLNSSELDKAKNLLYVVMELGSTDLSKCFKAEIQKYQCVREPDRVYYWKKMLEAVQAIHKAGKHLTEWFYVY